MSRTKLRDVLLLSLAAASLFFGGGLGCDPELDGAKLRIGSLAPFGYYMGIEGGKEPGNAFLQTSYPVKPDFGISARVGIFLEEKAQFTHNATIGIGFRQSTLADSYELRARYEYTPTAKLFLSSNLDGMTASCADGVLRAELDLDDNGTNVVARYRCEGQVAFTQLTSVASHYNAGERWFPYIAGSGLMKGGQLAFDDFRIASNGPFAMTAEAETAFDTFRGWNLALEAFYELESGNQGNAQGCWFDAYGHLLDAAVNFEGGMLGFSPDAEKLWIKGGKGFLKGERALFSDKPDKYFKGAPKFLEAYACSLFEMEPDF